MKILVLSMLLLANQFVYSQNKKKKISEQETIAFILKKLNQYSKSETYRFENGELIENSPSIDRIIKIPINKFKKIECNSLGKLEISVQGESMIVYELRPGSGKAGILMIGVFCDSEENFVTRLNKAFLNLKSYHVQKLSNDPF